MIQISIINATHLQQVENGDILLILSCKYSQTNLTGLSKSVRYSWEKTVNL